MRRRPVQAESPWTTRCLQDGQDSAKLRVITASTTKDGKPAHSPVSAWSDPRHVSPHSDLPSSPRGESPLRSQLVKVFAERNGCLVDPEHTICSAWGSQARMHCGTDSPTPPVLSSTLDGRSSVAPGCLSPSPASSPETPVHQLTPETAYGLSVLDALIKAGASHPARVPGTRRKGASASLPAIDASVSTMTGRLLL
jgi:hypothetical protein